ncbi:hypothetical protein D0809_08470 [Flavobacterium circumlabens]|uniref:Uncharacterized protein n=1 Tax=Flavobacterium circumlabens TaxID=2133765 RepID=A0A4Y7UFP0_9FLAO|nr:hypothetical protein [Flavobacterium circumlabens]TCN59948.1 hypothetical protein EV142_102568 [Flavobacterium circumlabens]TEB45194.1 hypothetical protein D0809_08470 [Flavobacterium circumlabens]
MIVLLNKIVKTIALKPKSIFLTDGFGALLTAVFLIAALSSSGLHFGMPSEILTPLLITASIFAVYSFSCFLFLKNKFQPFLKLIIAANLIYSILTLGFVAFYFDKLTVLGIFYFFGEILVLYGLVYIEFKILESIKTRNN